jgi:hypothetical protein
MVKQAGDSLRAPRQRCRDRFCAFSSPATRQRSNLAKSLPESIEGACPESIEGFHRLRRSTRGESLSYSENFIIAPIATSWEALGTTLLTKFF